MKTFLWEPGARPDEEYSTPEEQTHVRTEYKKAISTKNKKNHIFLTPPCIPSALHFYRYLVTAPHLILYSSPSRTTGGHSSAEADREGYARQPALVL